MKKILLLALLSLSFCEYCDDIINAKGVDDCKNQEIEYGSDEVAGQKNCCYYNGKFVDNKFEEGTGCTALTIEEEAMLRTMVQGLMSTGVEINISLECSPRDETKEDEETEENEEDSSSIKNLTFQNKNYLCILILSLLLILF